MEEKLAEYRARKAKEHKKYQSETSWKTSFLTSIGLQKRPTVQMKGVDVSTGSALKEQIPPHHTSDNLNTDNEGHVFDSPQSCRLQDEIRMPLTRREKVLNTASLVLKIVLWLILWALFMELGFGAVFFIVSSLIIIYRTMRSGSRDQSKLSAYSVFNPNFERLDGTFTAEQFEKELRYGAGSVR